MQYLGVDVGVSGGLALLDEAGAVVWAVKMPATDADLFALLPHDELTVAVLEKVHSSPQMGVTSAFTFGAGYGRCRMALAAAHIPFDELTPQVWQRKLGGLSGGDKHLLKARAQQLYPAVKITLATADALLLATLARRLHLGLAATPGSR
jgi:Holliday junction resolvasome RuvABC endonuclease subunit